MAIMVHLVCSHFQYLDILAPHAASHAPYPLVLVVAVLVAVDVAAVHAAVLVVVVVVVAVVVVLVVSVPFHHLLFVIILVFPLVGDMTFDNIIYH